MIFRCGIPLFLWLAVGVVGFAQQATAPFPQIDSERDWPWWRGPTRDGHAASQNAPTELVEGKNLDWAAPVPGRGHSSPIVVGNQVFLLTADPATEAHLALAFDRETGVPRWTTQLNQGGFPKKNHPKNTEGTPTFACDGERLFIVIFHHQAVWGIALSLDGEKLWETKLGEFNPKMYQYGYAPSPVLYGDLVIFSYEYDGPSAIVALKRDTGGEVWRIARNSSISFSTPVVARHKEVDYLLISGGNAVSAYDPANGKSRWSTPGTTMATCGTMVFENGIAFASGGYPKQETIAVDLATGDVLWRNNLKAYEQSMLATGGYLYCLTDNGILFCWEGKTGREMWKQRLKGPVSASGVLVGDKIYWANEAGQLWVFQASPEQYVEVSTNQIGDEAFASPAICGGQVFCRTAKKQDGHRQEYLLRFSARD